MGPPTRNQWAVQAALDLMGDRLCTASKTSFKPQGTPLLTRWRAGQYLTKALLEGE